MTNAQYMRKLKSEQYSNYPNSYAGTTTRLARSLFGKAKEISGYHAARYYLESRGLWPLLPGEGVRCATIKGCPVLIVELSDHEGFCRAVQYLKLTDTGEALVKDDGHKDRVTIGPAKGTCVWMASRCPARIGVAEGVETAMAVRRLYDLVCFATGGKRGLHSFRPPGAVTELIVCADNDEPGLEGAAYLRDRLAGLRKFGGRAPEVQIIRPKQPGWDFCDVWESRL